MHCKSDQTYQKVYILQKNGHTINFCWDFHPEKKTNKNNDQRGRPHGEKKFMAIAGNSSNNINMMEDNKKVFDQQAYLGSLQDEDQNNTSVVNQALAAQSVKGNNYNKEWITNSRTTHHVIDNLRLFHNYKLSIGSENVVVADGTKVSIVGRGSVL